MAPFYGWGLTASRLQRYYEEGTLHFTTKLLSILNFPKKLLSTVFQFACIDSKF